tara:strand:+ start:147 stop:338 length:192 start_codon:yes stop_codon:yes gene_type:complete
MMDLINNNCSPEARRIAEALQDNLPAEQFATSVAEVLRNEYGSHNFKAFITKLINELDNDTIG